MRVRLLFWTDLHIAERPPLARSDSYCEDLFAKLEELKVLAKSCDLTIMGGDWLHWPRPNDTSHRLVRRLIECLRNWPTTMYTCLGNHDVPQGRETLHRMPLGVILEALKDGPVQLLDEMEVDGVAFKAVHWSPEADQSPEPYRWRRSDSGLKARVQVTHGMVMPPGGGWPFEAVGMDQIDTDADLVLLGHTHWRVGDHRIHSTRYVGPGAVARTSRSESEMKRQPSALIVTVGAATPDGLSFEEIPLKSVRPAEEVFVWQEEKAGDAGSLFAGYVAALESGMNLEGLSVEEAVRAAEQKVPSDVMELTREYLGRAGL